MTNIDAFGQEHYSNDNRSSNLLDLFHYRYSNCDKLITFVAANFDVTDDKLMTSPIYRQIADYFRDREFVKVINVKGNSNRR